MGNKKSESQDAAPAETKPQKQNKGKLGDLPAEPARPDREVFEQKKALIDTKIEGFRSELKKLTEKISGCSTGKDEFATAKDECFERLNKTRQHIDELKAKKDALQDEIRKANSVKREAQQAERQLARDMKELNEETLEARITQLENKMQVETMDLKAEKGLMVEIKQLKAKRPEVQKKARKLEELKNAGNPEGAAGADKKSIGDALTEIRAELEKWMKTRDEQKEDIQKLKDERENQTGPIKEYINDRNNVKAKLTEQQNEMKELWDEFKGAQRKHNDWDKMKRELQKQKMEEERARSDELWNATKAKESLENTMEKPFFDELADLEQTIAFCKSFMAQDEVVVVDDSEAKDAKKKEMDGFITGAAPLLSKKDREAEMFHEGKKSKKGKKKADKPKSKGITHTAATFQMFAKMKVTAPMTVDDIPAALVKLEAQLDDYKVKLAAWELDAAKRQEDLKAADEKIKRLEAEEAAMREARKAEHKKAEEAEKAEEKA